MICKESSRFGVNIFYLESSKAVRNWWPDFCDGRYFGKKIIPEVAEFMTAAYILLAFAFFVAIKT
jgi:hypothetical protein